MCKVCGCLKMVLKLPQPFPNSPLSVVICNKTLGKTERGGTEWDQSVWSRRACIPLSLLVALSSHSYGDKHLKIACPFFIPSLDQFSQGRKWESMKERKWSRTCLSNNILRVLILATTLKQGTLMKSSGFLSEALDTILDIIIIWKITVLFRQGQRSNCYSICCEAT